MIYLTKEFESYWAGMDPFKEVEKLDGEMFRIVKARKTLRFELNGKRYFAKIHRGVGWREIVKNLLQFKLPVLGAQNEWAALNKLKKLGVDTMTPVAYGLRGKNPARQHSFIITEELTDTESLEDFCCDWLNNPPPFALKKALVEKLSWVSRCMHIHGMNHRDYYICHFMLDISKGRENIDPENIKVSLIDLHRARIRRKTPYRWMVKDVAGIYFSTMNIGLTKHDLFRFMKIYSNKPLRQTLHEDFSFWYRVRKVAERLYLKEFGRKLDL
ncbi:MAG: lipopolysaccharide core heptose(I) kinase RfaP [Desulfobacterales bacterium]|nr:lipopolysaccharide core heptose(I) kinase RfaP [Desulfobacterales bacterium]